MATEMDASVTAMCNHARNVLSFAKYTFGSTFTGTYKATEDESAND
jgi:hypothetical protein